MACRVVLRHDIVCGAVASAAMKECVCALCVVIVSACFRPVYDRPACGPNRECPDGLACSAALVCEPPVTLVDGGISGVNDASSGVPPDACAATFSGQLDTCQLTLGADVTLSGGAITYDTGTHMLAGSTATVAVTHAM